MVLGHTIFLRGARQLLTLRGPGCVRRGAALQNLGVIEDGSVLIRNGVISAVGPTRRIENLKEARSALEIRVHGKVVMPAFVDAGLNLSMRRTRHPQKRKRAREFLDEMQVLFESCFRHGTLTVEAKTSGLDGDGNSAILALRCIPKLEGNPVAVVPTWDARRSPSGHNRMADLEKTLTELVRRKLVQFLELDASECELDRVLHLFGLARKARLGVKIGWSGGPADALARLVSEGNPRTIRIESRLESNMISVLSKVPSALVVAPTEELLDGTCTSSSLRQVVDAGAAIVLSTGYSVEHPSSNSMQTALALAVIRLRLTPEEAISAATINAAWSAGVGCLTGSLEVDKQANVLVMNVPDYRELARQFGVNHVGTGVSFGKLFFNRISGRIPVQ
jgi:imidazolonepropionase